MMLKDFSHVRSLLWVMVYKDIMPIQECYIKTILGSECLMNKQVQWPLPRDTCKWLSSQWHLFNMIFHGWHLGTIRNFNASHREVWGQLIALNWERMNFLLDLSWLKRAPGLGWGYSPNCRQLKLGEINSSLEIFHLKGSHARNSISVVMNRT